MDEKKIQLLEESLALERKARKEAEAIMKQRSLDLHDKNQELEETNQTLSKVINEKQIELNNLFKTIIDPYILMDLYGNVLKMNNASIDFFGIDNEKNPFNVMDTLYEEDIEYAMNSFQEFLETGIFRNFQARIYNNLKEIKWVDINCNVVYDTEGNPTFAQGIIRDITQQKVQQQVFDEQKNQLNAIVDYSSLGIVLTKKGEIIKSNRAFQELLNYSEEELLALSVGDISLKEDKETSELYMKKLDNNEIEHFSINKRYRTKHGTVIWAKTNVSTVKTGRGNNSYQVAVVEDITEELQNQSLLKALNSLMSSILGKTDIYDIAWEISERTTELLNFEDLVIYLLDYKTGKLKQIAAHGGKVEKRKIIQNQLEISIGEGIAGYVAKTGKSEIISDTSKDKRYLVDDKVRLSEISVPIIANNEIIGVIDSEHSNKNFYTDYHLKTLETIANLAATQLKNALNLQLRIEADIENKALLKSLTKSNQELKDFAHVVSHDLKSPLRSMNALASWIKEENAKTTNQVIDDDINLLLKKIDKMEHLINGILKYASIDQVKSTKQKTDLHNLVKDIIDTIYIPKNIKINILNKLPKLEVEKFRIYQLFQNLISNAVKYNDKQEGIINITCKEEEETWLFSVQDNGIGISDKYHKKIFEIFQTLEKSEDSTGVGLSIVKKIVDIYEGKIWLTSKINEGTVFYFTLPK
ncbi:PAS domain-containing sensor histidine kinase [Tenacibaculum halocynthiae]|uniref:PAS domain-containing sensor histidine kinase n=1 Tax=Tenacibaculum halocynthiae TaxID=1254437 RepID=UPI003895C3B2